jgi:hypothetical protein
VSEKSLGTEAVSGVAVWVEGQSDPFGDPPRASLMENCSRTARRRNAGVQCRLPGSPKRKSWIRYHGVLHDAYDR